MTRTIHTFIASSLFVAVLTTSIFVYYPVREVYAQSGSSNVTGACSAGLAMDALSLVGGKIKGAFSSEVPTSDSTEQIKTITNGIKACALWLQDQLIKVALARLKKRLLDKLTDDTIAWINGEGEKSGPKYITNFGSVLQDSADAALGDTLRASGMGKLCSDRLSLQVQVSLRPQQKFSEGVSCTLTGAAKNVSAFADNFKNGGWIGYGQLLEPSNNKWGLQLLASDALDSKTTQRKAAATLESSSNAGFKGTKYCKFWTLTGVHKFDEFSQITNIARVPAESFSGGLLAPNTPPPATAPFPQQNVTYPMDFPANYTGMKYECNASDESVTTPGMVLADATQKAVTSDWNSLANMDDLTPYINAIYDAAVNRLKKEGVKGLQKASKDLLSDNGKAGYVNPPATADPAIAEAKTAYTAVLREASSTQALLKSATTQNADTIAKLNALFVCEQTVALRSAIAAPTVCTSIAAKNTALNDSAAQLATLTKDLATVTSALIQIKSQLDSGKLSITDLATANSLISDMRGKIAGFTVAIQTIIDATTLDAGLISTELSACVAAEKTNTSYSCPVW